MQRSLTEQWRLGPLTVPNRVMLAPLAGIGNWFVRLQAKRYGAGMAISEMVSSHAIHHRNQRTCMELLRIHPEERGRGLLSVQLFGADPEVMRSAASTVAATGADAIDINMGCPVPKVCRTGAGAALLKDHGRAVEVVAAAVEGGGLPVTVKLRSGLKAGDDSGVQLARRLATQPGVAAIAMHPRSAAVHHKGLPDYQLVKGLVQELPLPLILTGGLRDEAGVRDAFQQTGAAAVMLARGSLGNPWLFSALLEEGAVQPRPQEVAGELVWTMERAVEHLGPERALRWMRKAYPWYVVRLGLERPQAKALQESLQSAASLRDAQELLSRAVQGAQGTAAAALVGGPCQR